MKQKSHLGTKVSRIVAISWLILSGFVSILKADPVDMEKARAVALTQLRKVAGDNVGLRSSTSLDLVYEPKNEANQPYFYVFNGGKGFVIVSGDDRATPILGYSDEGSFDPDNIPPNMAEFLKGYQDEINFVIEQEAKVDTELNSQWQKLEKGEIIGLRSYSPNTYLIKSIWEQTYPYNQYCPGDAPVGCYGMAMAQIICYWGRDMKKAPSHGFGMNRYYNGLYGGYIEVDFESAFYDYENMTDYLFLFHPEPEQRDAVNLLSYHCGVAANTNYGTGSSSAYPEDGVTAFKNHFGYSNCFMIETFNQNGVLGPISYDKWVDTLKREIDNLRPVLHCGWASSGRGHGWVCDGYKYDETGVKFHMNWGWGGSSDGYFSLSSLNPGSYDYSYHQKAIINIYPDMMDAPTNVIYITPEGAGLQDGSSWENATPDLYGEMMKDRTDTMQIWVKKGIYYGDTIVGQGADKAAFILGKRNKVYGGFAGNEFSLSARVQNEPSILDGQHLRRVICQLTDFANADSSFIDGFTIRNGADTLAGSANIKLRGSTPYQSGTDMAGNGGGAYLRANGILKNCIIENSKAVSGGGVFNYGGKVVDCSFINNTAEHAAGLFNRNMASLANCTLSNNRAKARLGYGGAIYNAGTLYIHEHAVIEYNHSGLGGGLYNTGTVIMYDGSIGHNTCSELGGGIYSDGYTTGYDGQVTIYGGDISYNDRSGIVSHGTLTLYGGTISNNVTAGQGGGINCNNGRLNILGPSVRITQNIAQSGGGIYIGIGCVATISAGTIGVNTNVAPSSPEEALAMGGNVSLAYYGGGGDGGGIYAIAINFVNENKGNVIIGGNYSKQFGGGLWTAASCTLPSNVYVCANTTDIYGGGIYMISNATVTLNGGNVLNNKASHGGGIYISYGHLYMSGGKISGNEASGNGGGIYNYDKTLIVSGGEISGNTAVLGSGIYNYAKSFSLSGSIKIEDIIYITSSSNAMNLSSLTYHTDSSKPITIQGNTGYYVAVSSYAQSYVNQGILVSTPGLYPFVQGNYVYLRNNGTRSVEQSSTDNEFMNSEKISVYPTLVTSGGMLTIASPGGGTASVWNLSGMMVGQHKLVEGKTQVSISCPAGNYVVKVKTDAGEEKVMKIIVK